VDDNDIRQEWAERSGEYSPEYYAHYGPDETSDRVVAAVERHVGTDARVLEVGCSAGRHLAALHEAGFESLTGVDVNADALDVLAETYPALARTGTFHAGAVEEFVTGVDDDAFDVVFSVETLQHIPPDNEWVFDELSRVTSDLLVVVENEGREPGTVEYVDEDVPLFYRDWQSVFTDRGLLERESTTGKRDTLRVFSVE
jgi:2-polyprenyl-3-methyl-5-hydroxy-6-metoxy-1,4-benzoquinol methylase